MRASVLLLVVLASAVLITETEAGFFRRLVRAIKKHLKCELVGGKIRCYYVGRKKREADTEDNGEDSDCTQDTFPNGEIPRSVLDTVFNMTDADKSEGLNREEFVNYVTALGTMEDCIINTQGDPNANAN